MEPARRFTETEIQEVFARAASAQERADREAADLGLTTEELQAVGAEAGIDPAHVAAAARAVASGEPDDGRESSIGIPVGVRRAATLDATPSDEMWDLLVADLQDTFAARGTTERIGQARIWRNGNLRATLTPSGDGARLRLQSSRRANTHRMLLISAMQAVFAVSIFLGGRSDHGAALFAMIAVLLSASTVVRQVGWSRTREGQMDAVAARAQRTAQTLSARSTLLPDAEPPRLDLVDLDRQPEAETGTERRRTQV